MTLPNPERTRVVSAERLRSRVASEQQIIEAEKVARDIEQRATSESLRLQIERQDKAERDAIGLLARAQVRAEQIMNEARGATAELGLRIAERLIGESLRLDRCIIESIVQQVFKECAIERALVVRLHPDDHESLKGNEGSSSKMSFSSVSDDSITRGGCIIETDQQQIDGRLEVRLNALRAFLNNQSHE